MFRSLRFLTVNAFLSSAGVLLAGLAFPAIVFAQPPAKSESAELVADLETTPVTLETNSFSVVGELDGRLLFTLVSEPAEMDAWERFYGGLWISDGTAEGTKLLHQTGAARGFLGETDQGAWFRSASLGFTDGTPEGTILLSPPLHWSTRDDGEDFSALEPDSQRLYFYVGRTDSPIWVSDGTVAGTRPIEDLPDDIVEPSGFTAWEGSVFFRAHDGDDNWSLWVTDGTGAGTRQLISLPPLLGVRNSPSFSTMPTTSEGVVFARQPEGETPQLWVSDGTGAGTRQLPSVVSEMFPLLRGVSQWPGGVLVSTLSGPGGGYRLWLTDGTDTGTRAFVDLGDPIIDSAVAGDRMFFVVGDGLANFLYVSDGTPEGTRRLAGNSADFIEILSPFGEAGVLYKAFPFGESMEFWISDGTPEGTMPVTMPVNINPTGATWAAEVGDGTALMGYAETGSSGFGTPAGIFHTDGTAAGTRLVRELSGEEYAVGGYPLGGDRLLLPIATPRSSNFFDLARFSVFDDGAFNDFSPLPPAPTADSAPDFVHQWGDGMVFVLTRGAGRGDLYALPSEGGEPRRLVDAEALPGELFEPFEGSVPTRLGDSLYYLAPEAGRTDLQLWRLADDLSKAVPVTRSKGLLRYGPVAALGKLFWWAGENYWDSNLWVSDGTAAGTQLLAEGVGSDARLYDFRPAILNGELYFLGTAGTVFATDGTSIRSLSLDLEIPAVHRGSGLFYRLGGRLLFFADRDSVLSLWATDGTEEGTERVIPFTLNILESLLPGSPTLSGGILFFSFSNDEVGIEPFRSDGTAAGTYPLRDIVSGFDTSSPSGYTAFDDRVYFVAEEQEHGRELWVTDGTPAGTRLAADLYPGPVSSNPTNLKVVGDYLFWSADGGSRGEELWSLRRGAGTPVRWSDITAGAGSARPKAEAFLGERLFVSAFHPDYGRELWSLPADAGPPPPCGTDPLDLCLLDGRVRVRVSWTDQRSGKSGVGTPVPFSDKTGLFWLFDDANIELVVKALDGTGTNGHLWGFYGALSDVIYTVELTDTVTGRVRTFENPAGEICGGADTRALPVGDSALEDFAELDEVSEGVPGRWLPLPAAPDLVPRTTTSTCQPGAETLCLLGGRFAVTVEWDNQRAEPGEPNDAGTGKVIPSLGDGDKSGYFWFFDSANIELVVKALDGTGINGNYWFFYGALSDVEYTITVRDTVTGAEKTYRNEPGNICGGADNRAFPE